MPVAVWWVLGADWLSAVGSGLTLPFLMVYFHAVRHLGLGTAGAAVATFALAGLAGNPLGGAWADRFGPRRVLAAGWAVAGSGAVAIALVSTPWQAFAAAGLAGLGAALALPALDTLLAGLVPSQQRSNVFALRHATMNVGLAVGGLLSAVIVSTGRPSSFVWLYALDAASYVLALPLLQLGRRAVPSAASTAGSASQDGSPGPAPVDTRSGTGAGYLAVFGDGIFRRLWLLIAVLVAVGFAQFNAALPVFVTSTGSGAPVAGLAFAANTLTVTCCQLPALGLIHGHRRTGTITLLCALWATSWTLVLLATHLPPSSAALGFVTAAVVFGLGETLFAPTLPTLVNDIAPPALQGRYNGATAFAFTTGFALGPALSGLLLGHRLRTPLLLTLILTCTAVAPLAIRLRHHLPTGTDAINTSSPSKAKPDNTANPTNAANGHPVAQP
ncbi:MFS transporter [Streptomyces sp. NPDC001139]